jgi:hypothetical protein
MSHWFDRLATWSAENGDDGEGLLTRRQAVRAAATGAGGIGLLGSPLVGEALGLAGGNSPACKCWDKADRINNKANLSLIDNLGSAALVSPAAQVVFLGGLITSSAAFLGQVVHCGVCRDDPPLKPPPPKFQPCTARGGLRLSSDQCGGGGGGDTVPQPPQTSCAPGTKDCGGGLCCFGTDLCCGGCCCIVEIGCTCCG